MTNVWNFNIMSQIQNMLSNMSNAINKFEFKIHNEYAPEMRAERTFVGGHGNYVAIDHCIQELRNSVQAPKLYSPEPHGLYLLL